MAHVPSLSPTEMLLVLGLGVKQLDGHTSQVKLMLYPKQKANPQQAEQGHAQMQKCV
jgi:hypothetical protein